MDRVGFEVTLVKQVFFLVFVMDALFSQGDSRSLPKALDQKSQRMTSSFAIGKVSDAEMEDCKVFIEMQATPLPPTTRLMAVAV